MSRPAPHPVLELSAYLDGELGAERGAEIEVHLSSCPACSSVLADLRGLVGAASRREDRRPDRDLWPAIQSRIEPRADATVVPIERRTRRLSFTWSQLAAASIALVVLAGGGMWLALSGRAPVPGGAPATVASAGNTAAGDSGVAPGGGAGAAPAGGNGAAPAAGVRLAADFADATYTAAVEDLRAALEASRDQLDPETVRTVEENLAIIDRAIGETRRALAADPNSIYLSEHLARQMQRKLDVLRTATSTVATSSI